MPTFRRCIVHTINRTVLRAVTAICHKSRGGVPVQATSLCPSILLSSLPSHGLSRGSAWTELAHPLPNILMQFIQLNSASDSIFDIGAL